MLESLKKRKKRAEEINTIFKRIYKNADCTLNYNGAFQLLIATQLAAQCTDERVNKVTPALFSKYPDAFAFANADLFELMEDIKSTGFFRNKAKNIIACSKLLLEKYNGEVPDDLDELLALPGVGRKTANLVLGDFFGIPGIVVDTHASRLSYRMGLTDKKEPYKIELDLMELLPPCEWSNFCHRLVYHGREYCNARRPKCDDCPIASLCPKCVF